VKPDHVRENGSPLAAAEKRLLVWMARQLPSWVSSDQLSALGLASMGLAGVGFWAAQFDGLGLAAVVAALGLNWFGDSLDGTLARVRGCERPRFGFYVDHVIDVAGASLLLVGLGASGYMTPVVALALLAAYLLVSAEVYLATHARGAFRMSFLGFGPTELRIVLAIGAVSLVRWPVVAPFGLGPWKLFDVGGVVALCGLVLAFAVSAARNTRALWLAEPLPPRQGASRQPQASSGRGPVLLAVAALAVAPGIAAAGGPDVPTQRAWKGYVAATAARIASERSTPLALTPALRRGEVIVAAAESRTPEGTVVAVPGGLVHHWRGRMFVPGTSLDLLLAEVRAVDTFLRQPDVRAARILRERGDGLELSLRLTRSQIVTATFDTDHVVTYERPDPRRAFSVSTATRIVELEPHGNGFRPRVDRGFLWGLQAWWRYEAVDGGVIVDCETVSLSRRVPWAARPLVLPFVTRFARDSMVRTLDALRAAVSS
jgi:phosphatidylglycerophosphate synthase